MMISERKRDKQTWNNVIISSVLEIMSRQICKTDGRNWKSPGLKEKTFSERHKVDRELFSRFLNTKKEQM